MKVELMARSGDDILVVNAARASFGKETEWVDYSGARLYVMEQLAKDSLSENRKAKLLTYNDMLTEKSTDAFLEGRDDPEVLSFADWGLVNFLAREHHLLPFRHPQITLRCKAPVFLARQLGKHQVGFSWSEESRRYITTEPEFYWPSKWRKKAEDVKQGSSDEAVEEFVVGNPTPEYEEMFGKVPPTKTQYLAETVVSYAMMQYTRLLEGGVAPELARMILPQNLMVTWVWTGSLLGFYQMYAQRSFPTAQKEARDFATLVKEVIKPLYPVSWTALKEHQPWEEGRDG